MRKYIVGGLAGAALMFSVTAFADGNSIIGKVIQGEYSVKVIKVANPAGETLSTKSIAVDGTTYVPLRVAADTFGYDADFANKMVILTERSGGTVTKETLETSETTPETPSSTQETVEEQIASLSSQRSMLINQAIQLLATADPNSIEVTQKVKKLNDQAAELQKQIDELKNAQ